MTKRDLQIAPQLLRLGRFAALVDVSRSKIYTMISAGELRAVRVGGSLRIPAEELDRLKTLKVDHRVEE
jgi:excisionase family DNA binding protein